MRVYAAPALHQRGEPSIILWFGCGVSRMTV